ncbi:MAG: glycosyltransferase family 2 protein [Thermoanaerobaculia bacterium]
MAPALSVVIPVHDRGDLLRRCLAALDSWQWPGESECVVVDDGSRDPEVAAVRRERSDLRWLAHPDARGFSAAVNAGLAASRGEILLLLNSDAEPLAAGAKALAERFAAPSPPGARPLGAVAATLRYPDGRPQWSGGREPTLAWLFALASGWGRGLRGARPSGSAGGEVGWAPAAALALSRAAWNATGPFDERFQHYAQDLDYGHRLRAAGFRIVVEPLFPVLHHLGGSAGADADGGQRLDRLWSDLVTWIAKARGADAARAAARALVWGARLRKGRLLGRETAAERARIAVARTAAEAAAAAAATAPGAG